ncbi:DNA polymerase III subunit [Legionella nagasakiensis]|uniref:DNA polymerase III subunit n=1 Tax=Legionella nagasakiensis TaxID=535290 RepID=UPI0010565DF9|nr:DNA polymerase III subunit [Legionella nagasakiensis]
MQSQYPINLLSAHASLWQRLQPLLDKQQLPQALLFIGPQHGLIPQLVNRLIAMLICQQGNACGSCSACHLLIQGYHPDIHRISMEAQDKAIKIEQIRELQLIAYQTPQRGIHRFIVVEPAEKMNVSAANALLKILEEPPQHVVFILIAEQIGNMLPTIISRCQRYIVSDYELFDFKGYSGYLTLGQLYPEETTRAQLYKQREVIIASLCDLLEHKTSLCSVASLWSAYAFDDLLWFLYLVHADVIHAQLTENQMLLHPEKLVCLATCTHPLQLFSQMDKIKALMQKINHNININQTLAIEDLLIGYLRETG